MAKLSYKKRKALPKAEFAGPDRSYPIDTANRARNALSRVSQFGSPDLKARVRRKVHEKFPSIGKMEGGMAKPRLDKVSRRSGGNC